MHIGSGVWKDLSHDAQEKRLKELQDRRDDAERRDEDHASLDREIREIEDHRRPH